MHITSQHTRIVCPAYNAHYISLCHFVCTLLAIVCIWTLRLLFVCYFFIFVHISVCVGTPNITLLFFFFFHSFFCIVFFRNSFSFLLFQFVLWLLLFVGVRVVWRGAHHLSAIHSPFVHCFLPLMCVSVFSVGQNLLCRGKQFRLLEHRLGKAMWEQKRISVDINDGFECVVINTLSSTFVLFVES